MDSVTGNWEYLTDAIVEEFYDKRGVVYFNIDDNETVSGFLKTHSKPIRNTRIAIDKTHEGVVCSRVIDVSVSVYTSSRDPISKKDRVMCYFKVVKVDTTSFPSSSNERNVPIHAKSAVWDHYRQLVLDIDTNK